MFDRKAKEQETRYVKVKVWSDGDMFLSNAKTREEWERVGIEKDRTDDYEIKYYKLELDKLQEVDLALIISTK